MCVCVRVCACVCVRVYVGGGRSTLCGTTIFNDPDRILLTINQAPESRMTTPYWKTRNVSLVLVDTTYPLRHRATARCVEVKRERPHYFDRTEVCTVYTILGGQRTYLDTRDRSTLRASYGISICLSRMIHTRLLIIL